MTLKSVPKSSICFHYYLSYCTLFKDLFQRKTLKLKLDFKRRLSFEVSVIPSDYTFCLS